MKIMNPHDLAILIPTRNRPARLQRTLEELIARGFGDHPLFVYDDASDEPWEIDKALALWPGATLLRGKNRCGQAMGRNQLLRAMACPYALCLEDDTWPEEYAALMTAFETIQADGIAVATFQSRSLGDGRLAMPLARPRGPSVGFLGGASLFHVPSVLSVGGYREFFTYGYEEPELALRLWQRGLRIEYFPDVVVAHNHLETPDERRDHREYDFLYARNGILMSSLNMPLWFGLPHGLARSLRLSLRLKRNLWQKAKGTIAGIWLTFARWQQRTPCSFSKALQWCRFNRASG